MNHKILTYLLFVSIATVFWLLNELGNDYTATIDYPVRFSNFPDNKVLISELPKKLTLNVNGYGFTLLRFKLSPSAYPVIINMETFGSGIKNPKQKQFTLNTKHIRESVNKQLPNEIDVIDVMPDTIVFRFANIRSKKIPVKFNGTLQFEDQCRLRENPIFKPDSILVTGPDIVLDTMKFIYTKYEHIKKISDPIDRNIALKEYKNIAFEQKKVAMHLPVAKFTQANYTVTINSKNVPDSLTMITFPRIANVSALIALEDFNKVTAPDIILEVDYLDISQLLGQKIGVKLAYSPNYLHNVTFYPTSVEYLLDKKR